MRISSEKKYPYGVCRRACVWSGTCSVACTRCEQWFHKEWLQMPAIIYEGLENTYVSWYCCTCSLPNFKSLFEEFDADSSLSSTPTRTFSSHNGCAYIGSPRYTSSPTSYRRCPTVKRKLRVIVMTLQNIRAKRKAFWAMLENSAPDVILATET